MSFWLNKYLSLNFFFADIKYSWYCLKIRALVWWHAVFYFVDSFFINSDCYISGKEKWKPRNLEERFQVFEAKRIYLFYQLLIIVIIKVILVFLSNLIINFPSKSFISLLNNFRVKQGCHEKPQIVEALSDFFFREICTIKL